MSLALIILIILAAALLWVFLSFAFKPVGKVAYRLWEDVNNAMNEEEVVSNEELREEREKSKE